MIPTSSDSPKVRNAHYFWYILFWGILKIYLFHLLYHFLKTCENRLSSLLFISQVQIQLLKTPTEFCSAKVRKHWNVKIPCTFYLPFSERLQTFWAFCDSHTQLCKLGCHASSDRSHSKHSDIVLINNATLRCRDLTKNKTYKWFK